jgi:sialidase-1
MRSDDFWPSIHAAEGLTLAGYGGEVIEYLTPHMADETDDQHLCGIARELVRAGDTSRVEILTSILRGRDTYAHTHAAESLYKLGLIGDEDAMRAAAQSGEVTRELMAAGALARTGDEAALGWIRNTYETGGVDAVRIGAWLLGRIGDQSDIARLRTRIEDTPPGIVRAYIHHSLAALGDPTGLDSLVANLSSNDAAIRTYAATFAGDSGRKEIAVKLLPLLDDVNADTRYRAAQSILILSGARATADAPR